MTVGGSQVPSTQTDFPKLSFPTDSRFKTVANGGHVASGSGFDIRPYSDSSLTTPLTYELVYYNPSTGQFEMHIKIPSLSNGYVTYFGYGDSSLITDGSSSNTWSNGFRFVYHLKDGATLSVADSLGVQNGTNHSATATTGQIDGGAGFVSASSQYIALSGAMAGTASLTYSAWINGTSFPNAANVIIGKDNTAANGAFAFMKVNNTGSKLGVNVGITPNISATGTTTLSTATWYYVAMVYDATLTTGALKGYLNANVDASANNGSPTNLSTASDEANIGQLGATNPGLFWNGSIDEARIASVARSGDWITTEYNNQFAPGTFETLGAEVSISPMLGIYTI